MRFSQNQGGLTQTETPQQGGLIDLLIGRDPGVRSGAGGFIGLLEGASGAASTAPRSTAGGRQADRGSRNEPGSRQAITRARQAAVARARGYISNADVSAGADEDGYYEVYNTRTGEATSYAGSRAGRPTNVDFKFDLRVGNDEILLVTAHSHPSEPTRPDIDDNNENINNNKGDKRLRRYAPVVLKTPSGRVRTFNSPFEYKDINERRKR